MRLPVAGVGGVRRGIAELVRADLRATLGMLALTVLAAAAGLIAPRLLGSLVNGFGAGVDTATVDRVAAVIVALALAQLLLTRYARRAALRLGERTLRRLREGFVARVLNLPPSIVEHAGTGDLTTRGSTDVAVVGSALRDALPEILVGIVHSALLIVAVLLLDPLLGGCLLLGLPVMYAVTRWYLRRARTAYLAEGAANSGLAEEMGATAEGARTVEALGLRQARIAALDSSVALARASRLRTLRLRTVFLPVLDLGHAVPAAAVLLVGGLRELNGTLSLGTVVAAGLYAVQLADPMNRILHWVEQLQPCAASFARITGVAEVSTTVRPTGEVPADNRLRADGVSFAYREGHDVLSDVDLSVRVGERVAVVGPSGAGKSTLGRLLAGIEAPRAGSVTVGGVAVSDLDTAERRRRVVMVTQEHHVFLGTLRDNLTVAAEHASDPELRGALSTVDASWVADLPDGLDTVLGARGTRLDAAAQQQIALARVVLADPATVILDEATALLDPATARHTEAAMYAALRGRTVLSIAHRLHTARDADRVVVLDGGRITEVGGHDELIAADGGYAALWRSWHGS